MSPRWLPERSASSASILSLNQSFLFVAALFGRKSVIIFYMNGDLLPRCGAACKVAILDGSNISIFTRLPMPFFECFL